MSREDTKEHVDTCRMATENTEKCTDTHGSSRQNRRGHVDTRGTAKEDIKKRVDTRQMPRRIWGMKLGRTENVGDTENAAGRGQRRIQQIAE
jgi:hypothetical protein